MSTSVTRLKTGTLASVNETIGLNDTISETERATFDFQAKNIALQQEFIGKRDKLRQEYVARLAEITVGE